MWPDAFHLLSNALRANHASLVQARSKLSQLHESRQEAQRSLEQCDATLDGAPGVGLTALAELSAGVSLTERGGFGAMVKVE